MSPPPETAALFSSNADAPRSLKLETATETDARCVNKLKRGRSGPNPNNNSPSRPAGDAVYHAHMGWRLACPGGERGARAHVVSRREERPQWRLEKAQTLGIRTIYVDAYVRGCVSPAGVRSSS